MDFENLKDIITQYITPHSRILNLGCGNSPLMEDMFKEGYHLITNLDFSKTVIDQMSTRHRGHPATVSCTPAD